MAFLSILFLLFSFVFLGVGSGSSGVSDVPLGTSSSTSTGCVVVTWRKGQPAHKRGCRRAASGGGGVVHPRAVLKCSARMMADGHTRQRCGPPPANP